MAEGTKVRVVRCPKCENLLPELPGYTVYQCGGCGAVLRAKKQTSESDGSSEKSGKGHSGELKRLGDTSGTDRETDGPELELRRLRPERAAGSNATSSRPGFMEVVSDNNGGFDTILGKQTKYRYPSKAPAEDWVMLNDQEMNLERDELAKAQMEKEAVGVIKSQTAIAREPVGSGQIPDERSSEKEGSMAFRRTLEPVVEDFRFLTPRYPDEGPSNYQPGSSYGYGEPRKNQSNLDGPSRVEYLEQDRTELLRKLDELKAQLSRSCDMVDKPKEGVPVDRRTVLPPPDPYGGHGAWLPESLPGPSRAAVPCFVPDKHVPRPAYFSQGHESIPLMNRHHVDVQQNFHPPLQTPNEIPGYSEAFGHQMLQRVPHQPSHQFSQRPSHEYFSGHYTDIDSEPLALYPHNSFFDQATCFCLHCYNKHWQVPGHIPPPVYSNRRHPDIPTSSMFNHLETSVPFSSHAYNPRAFNLPVYSREPHNHARRPSLVDPDMGGFNRGRPQRVVIANGNRRRCHPIAGGSPFITCHICFELLRLPKKLILMERNELKVRCGACSTVIPIAVDNKRLLVSVLDETMKTHPELPGGYDEVMTGLARHNGYTNKASTNSSDDYDNSDYFKFTEAEHVLLGDDHRLNLSESANVHDLLYSSSSPSEDEESPDSVITRREMSNTAKLPPRANGTPPVPGSPLRGHPDLSSSDHLVSKLERGSRSKRLDQEKAVLNKVTLRQDSLKDASVATEMEVSFNEYLSRNSGEASKEEDQPRVSKGGESFFVGLIKKSFRDFSRSNQTVENGKAKVSINGHPIPDRLVRKAEKLAGPIQPGQYWYDSRAGFWGVIGRPCLGIIPPFIEEFNYPMPQNCAGGNTGVLLNGRELHQKDLDLLAGRGLPITRDKSYIVEISGKILDEDSGEELDSLGKLAPTVEKLKHGFGMQAPRVDV